MSVAEKRLTAEEFFWLPEPIDGGKMELVRGRVVSMCPVGGEHGEIALAIGAELRAFARKHQLGSAGVEAGFRLGANPDTVRAPDAYFVSFGRLPGGKPPVHSLQRHPT